MTAASGATKPERQRLWAVPAVQKQGNPMRRTLFGLTAALLLAGPGQAQNDRLTIMPGHDKLIEEYVVTERVQPVTVTVPLEIGATVPSGIQLDPVPMGLVAKVPEVRNCEYFVAGRKVVFVEPYTRKILQIVQ
jgi:uncharacterized protein DUF1236